MENSLASASYVSLETFRKDGTGVKTPVWAAAVGDKLMIGTPGASFKVKRIRANEKVRVAVCNASGSQILGPWYEGKARVVDGAQAEQGDAALTAKYGIQRRALNFFVKIGEIFGRRRDAVIIEVTVGGEVAPSH
jgi:PPOX class probable F420-dependent enzyme